MKFLELQVRKSYNFSYCGQMTIYRSITKNRPRTGSDWKYLPIVWSTWWSPKLLQKYACYLSCWFSWRI